VVSCWLAVALTAGHKLCLVSFCQKDGGWNIASSLWSWALGPVAYDSVVGFIERASLEGE
jgi:hypothetical protein